MNAVQTTPAGTPGRPSRDAVVAAVRTALARTRNRPLDEIRLETDLEADLGLDSMALIEVNIAIEEQLGVPVPAGETPELVVRTVADLAAFVLERAGALPC
jgi:acyl carrier protein